jgi:hypothetical protein
MTERTYEQYIKIIITEVNDGEVTEAVISKDISNTNLAGMLDLFYKTLLFLTYTYVEDLVAETTNGKTSTNYGHLTPTGDYTDETA